MHKKVAGNIKLPALKVYAKKKHTSCVYIINESENIEITIEKREKKLKNKSKY